MPTSSPTKPTVAVEVVCVPSPDAARRMRRLAALLLGKARLKSPLVESQQAGEAVKLLADRVAVDGQDIKMRMVFDSRESPTSSPRRWRA